MVVAVVVVAVVVVVVVAVVVVVVVAAAVVGVATVVVVVSKEEEPGGRVTTSAPHFTANFPVARDRENGRPVHHTHTHVHWQHDRPHARQGTRNSFIVQCYRNLVYLKIMHVNVM